MLASLNKKGEDFSCTSARGRNGWKEGAQMGSGGGKQKNNLDFHDSSGKEVEGREGKRAGLHKENMNI